MKREHFNFRDLSRILAKSVRQRLPEGPSFRQSLVEVCVVSALVLFLAWFHWDFVNGRRFIFDDTLQQFYPGANYFSTSIASGRFPLWFPGVRNGLPFYSDTQLAVFYPLQWVLPLFVKEGRLPFIVYQRYIFLHCLLGGVFMYAYLRQLKLRPASSLLGSLVFCLSGFFALRMTVNFVMIQTYIWLPLQLFFVDRLTTTGSRWAWAGLGAAIWMSLLAGHPQTAVYCWYLVIGYWLYRGYLGQRQERVSWATALVRCAKIDLPKIVGTFVLVAGAAAIVLLPQIQNWSLSVPAEAVLS